MERFDVRDLLGVWLVRKYTDMLNRLESLATSA